MFDRAHVKNAPMPYTRINRAHKMVQKVRSHPAETVRLLTSETTITANGRKVRNSNFMLNLSQPPEDSCLDLSPRCCTRRLCQNRRQKQPVP